MKWQEFGDSFKASIHRNPNLQPVDKFNYLRAELEGDSSVVISGLELTNSNYEVAVNLLQERFGRDELMMDAHYSALMDLPVSLNVTAKLRETYDMIEKHLRCLKALGENVDQPHFVFLIKSKLPKAFSDGRVQRHGGEVDSGKHPKGIKAVHLCSRSWRRSNTSDSEP